ncbi:hypothetical protein TWF481_005610 [Arthrobotrys musiformis]|uniref:Uncharacterized protein n=1 Tax=Arthrobotrys musiformis TaxID=47236 RepID=A0AAV9WEB3_9PEZI
MDYADFSEEACEFLEALKKHSEHWSHKLSLKINIPWCAEFLPMITENFRLENITYLRIRSDEDTQSGGAGEGIDIVIDNIRRLTTLLQQVPFLNHLELDGPEHDNDRFETPIEPLLPELRRLQSAILGLKKLYKLATSELLFHPSFFITPPENARKVTISQVVSREWWRQFSQCPFAGVEELVLIVHADYRPEAWASPDDIDNRAGEWGSVFKIGSLAVTGLKRLKWPTNDLAPHDFFELALARNPGLDEESRKNCEYMQLFTKHFAVPKRKTRRRRQ